VANWSSVGKGPISLWDTRRIALKVQTGIGRFFPSEVFTGQCGPALGLGQIGERWGGLSGYFPRGGKNISEMLMKNTPPHLWGAPKKGGTPTILLQKRGHTSGGRAHQTPAAGRPPLGPTTRV